MKTLIILIFLSQVFGLGYKGVGTLWPAGQLAISNSFTNTGLYANYTITFLPDTMIPAGGILEITFPEQYEDKLGTQGTPICLPGACTNSGKTMIIEINDDIQQNTEFSISVLNILNPLTVGGTGNFQLKSYYLGSLLDMNMVFGKIGISDAKTDLEATTVSILNGNSDIAGDITKFLFTFQFNQVIVSGSYIRFTFPGNGFYLPPNPTCTSFATEGSPVLGNLICTTTGRQVILTGISEDLKTKTQYSIRISGTNPA